MVTDSLSAMTVDQLSQLMNNQDQRWENIVALAQSTRNPAAPQAKAFFNKTWRAVFSDYFHNVAARVTNPAARVPTSLIMAVLLTINDKVYPSARKLGFPESSFLFPVLFSDLSTNRASVGAEGTELPHVPTVLPTPFSPMAATTLQDIRRAVGLVYQKLIDTYNLLEEHDKRVRSSGRVGAVPVRPWSGR